MPAKATVADLGYRMRQRLLRGLKSRNSKVRWDAERSLQQQARHLRQLAVYAAFLQGQSVTKITAEQEAWSMADVEAAIRSKGGLHGN